MTENKPKVLIAFNGNLRQQALQTLDQPAGVWAVSSVTPDESELGAVLRREQPAVLLLDVPPQLARVLDFLNQIPAICQAKVIASAAKLEPWQAAALISVNVAGLVLHQDFKRDLKPAVMNALKCTHRYFSATLADQLRGDPVRMVLEPGSLDPLVS